MDFTLDADSMPRRLDQALADLLPDRSRSFLARLIDDGHVRVDGEPALKRSRSVSALQTISIEVPEASPLAAVSQEIPLRIVFEDSDLVIVDKPAGLVVHPGAGHSDLTLVNALLFHIRDLSGIGGVLRPGIVHRLDKDTSGLIVVAKNDDSHRALTSSWGSAEVRKEYLALVYGTPRTERGRIEKPIGRDPKNRKKMAIVATGREAVTLFTLEEQLAHVSLLRCSLLTGRTHQIRVHLKSIGHPIVGDPVYSGPQWKGIPDKKIQKLLSGFQRQALHATLLSFPHPRTGKQVSFDSPLPDDFAALMTELRGESG